MEKIRAVPGMLRKVRRQAMYSQQELADEAGVSVNTIWRIEQRGEEDTAVYGRTARKLAGVLGVSASDLFVVEEADELVEVAGGSGD